MKAAEFRGVFSSLSGDKAHKGERQYWFIWESVELGQHYAQLLDSVYRPVGEPQLVESESFQRRFQAEPGVTIIPMLTIDPETFMAQMGASSTSVDAGLLQMPGMRRVAEWGKGQDAVKNTRVDKGILGETETYSASKNMITGAGASGRQFKGLSIKEMQEKFPPDFSIAFDEAEFDVILSPAAKVDKQLRKSFSSVLNNIKGAVTGDAITGINKVLEETEGIIPAHKHTFTDFGIHLRKCELLELAGRSFRRAVELGPTDPNAYYNLAKVYSRTGKNLEAKELLDVALALDPGMECAIHLRETVSKKL